MNLPQGRAGGVEAELATALRGTIEADEGFELLEFDWKAQEALLTGWFAEDPGYMKLSLMDSHGFYTSYILAYQKKIEKPFRLDDPDLQAKLDWLKKKFPTERAIGKQINLATSYGMQEAHLAEIVKCSKKEAKIFLQLKEEMAPLVAAWKKRTQLQAHTEGRLVNPWGYVRAFFDVLQKRDDGTLREGSEANEALAFLPQSSGASILRETLVTLDETLDEEIAQLLVPVHDSILLQARHGHVEETAGRVRGQMEREWPELKNLSIKVSMKRGFNWADLKEFYL